MKDALFFGLFAALFFGINPIFYKLAISEKKIDPVFIMLLYSGGSFFLSIIIFLITKPNCTITLVSTCYGISAGILYGLGLLCVALAFAKGVPASLMVPLYSINALITVCLGIFWLNEIPDIKGIIKIITGTILIIVGAIIVSLYKN